ncbi:NAD(P)/FAD-dependent oxidoreductase [Winogradskyella litorisediminis]|uniref:NAD(P)/FAD-dependent oxidoreductase n=1 Tax=Winogradskyella litorisediminis TaxID=1156618 RepID=A0ABW3N8F4_9FLAO
MKNVDYIVIGCGLAGIAFCEVLKANHKSFVVFDDNSQQSSKVAVGLYNPVVLKRFSAVWKAKEQLDIALPNYKQIEAHLNTKIDFPHSIHRRLNSIEEQNKWFTASDKPNLEPFMSANLKKNTNKFIDAPFGFGEVLNAGRVDTDHLISVYKDDLRQNDCLIETSFQYDALQFLDENIIYKEIQSKHIIFAEGFGVKQNPFFQDIPLNGTKGEVLTIKAPNLKLDEAVKSSVFIIPIGKDLYRVGATYERTDKTNDPTKEAKEELLQKLKTFIKCDFEVVDHRAGIRPTVKDRRPIIGRHSDYKNVYILNGLGSRGVMIAPYVSQKLFSLIENNQPIDKEIDVDRFT